MDAFSNPKRPRRSKYFDDEELYRYYAGFADEFVEDALAWCNVPKQGKVLDPWNGAGTTTRISQKAQVQSIGFDLNPTMAIVGKANLSYALDAPIICPLAIKIIAAASKAREGSASNPLEILFSRKAAEIIKSFTIAAIDHFVMTWSEDVKIDPSKISPLPALFLVGIFNATRSFIGSLSTSNPTWIKTPTSDKQKIDFSREQFDVRFLGEMNRLAKLVAEREYRYETPVKTEISVGDARCLPISSESVNAVITSPPYCTRLDYARSTMPELLILQSIGIASYQETRNNLTGASTARKMPLEKPEEFWGDSCQILLDGIKRHPSQASKTYYYASHFNYFYDLGKSIAEISRVVKCGGKACIVVQDSHYKEIHNDLPEIMCEMANNVGFKIIEKFYYLKNQSIRSINSASKAHRGSKPQMEAALLFERY